MKFLKIVEEIQIYDYYPQKQGRKKQYELLKRIVLSPVSENRKCLDCEKCSWNFKQKNNSIEEKILTIKNL